MNTLPVAIIVKDIIFGCYITIRNKNQFVVKLQFCLLNDLTLDSHRFFIDLINIHKYANYQVDLDHFI